MRNKGDHNPPPPVPDESLSLFPFGTGVLGAAPAGIQKTLRDFGVSGGLRHALGFGALLPKKFSFLHHRATIDGSGPQNFVEFERLVYLQEPFGAVRCAAAAGLIQRQFQVAQQTGDFLARRHVAQTLRKSAEHRLVVERRLVGVVERSKAAWKKFALHRSLGKAID